MNEKKVQKIVEDVVNEAVDAIMSGMDKIHEENTKRFDEHDKRFDEHDKRFDKHDSKFDEIKEIVQSNTSRIDDLETLITSRPTRKEFNKLRSQVLKQ